MKRAAQRVEKSDVHRLRKNAQMQGLPASGGLAKSRGMRRISRYAAVTRDEQNAADGRFSTAWPSRTQGGRLSGRARPCCYNQKKGATIMNILNFVIAIVALIIAILAFQRTGGTKELRKTTAELLAKMEKRMREDEAAKQEKDEMQQ
jgi:hypothetical protein